METFAYICSVIVTGMLSGAIGAYATLRVATRTIEAENITKERAKWRNKIRRLARQLHQAATDRNSKQISEIQLQLRLNLNPDDDEDLAILRLVRRLRAPDADVDRTLSEFSDRVSLLLKHDWERAKKDAVSFFRRAALLVKRETYDEYPHKDLA